MQNIDWTYLFEMMYGQPDLSLGIEDTSQVTPGNSKARLGFNCFQVAGLKFQMGTAAHRGESREQKQGQSKKMATAKEQNSKQDAMQSR